MMGLIHRMSIGSKLLLLGALVLGTVSVPLYLQLRLSQELIAAADGERAGLDPARKLMKLVQLTQQHRGLSAAFLGGNASVQAAREAKKAEVDKTLAALEAQIKAAAMPPALVAAWNSGVDDWRALEAAVDGRSLSAAESSSKHAAVIVHYFKTVDLLLDHSGLILDPQADSYYLMTATLIKLPFATEALGQTRARGAGFLAEGQIGPDGRAMMAGLVQQANDHYQGMLLAFDKAFAANPGLKASLGARLEAARTPVQASLDLARKEVVAADPLKYPAPDYIASFTQTIDTLFTLEEAALGGLENELDGRASALRRTQYVQFGLLGLMLLGVSLLARQIVRSITEPLNRAVSLAEQIARGDLTGEAQIRGRDEIAKLMTALAQMKDSLHRVVGQVRGNAESVATASQEIALGNGDLSRRTEQQASSLQQTASSMEELTGTVKLNADHARDANQLAQQARELALRGGSAVDQVIETMRGIDASSKKISDIIGVIDGIAFQTNILALNAAVEAARAGDQGRGFAVVAGEVRGLAKRSADAAKEIKSLITASVDRADHPRVAGAEQRAGSDQRCDRAHGPADAAERRTGRAIRRGGGEPQGTGGALGRPGEHLQAEQGGTSARRLTRQAAPSVRFTRRQRARRPCRRPRGRSRPVQRPHPSSGSAAGRAAGTPGAADRPGGWTLRRPGARLQDASSARRGSRRRYGLVPCRFSNDAECVLR